MSKLTRRFRRDKTGSMVEQVALFSAAVALACVLGANLLSTMLQNGELPVIAWVQPGGHSQRLAGSIPAAGSRQGGPAGREAGVDMSPTASIAGAKKAVSGVSPCEKDRK